ncbi:hypothetical protein ACFZDG_18450 [Kitasatospora xanthocidica]|uniref:VG15 protein n=1 Tax=Kitasatospora xanthocidica TaxID=83382 RepID=UPI0036F0A865
MAATAEEIAQTYYLRQAALGRRVADRVQALWWSLDQGDLTGSWDAAAGPAIVQTVTAGQLAAAAPADAYVRAVTTADGAEPDAAGAIRIAAWAGHAADGRDLNSLLYEPVITTKRGIAAGLSTDDAMLSGLHQLLTMATTEVADAGRSATGASITANRTTTGYVRVLSPPSCARCVVLAGKEYGWNRGFQRHPHCDCVHLPVTRYRRGRPTMDPDHYFHSLSRAEQDRAFTVAGAQAIRDGADITAVVNARRGISTVGSWVEDDVTHRGRIAARAKLGKLTTTTEGMTRRGLARQRLRNLQAQGRAPARARLTPEAIYELASDRDDAIRLLYRYGYLY